jgi:oligopeptide transport system substrate-binding protein
VLHSFDPEEARRLFAAAGYGPGKELPKLQLSAWSPSQSVVLEAIQQMWKRELGVDVNLAIEEAKVHLDALAAGNYDIAFATTILDVADAAAVLDDFTDGAANNFSHWHSAEFDRLIAEAKTQRDDRAQAAKLAEAETLLLQAAPVAPIYFNAKNWLMSPRVRGWQEDAVWTRFFQNVSLDEK